MVNQVVTTILECTGEVVTIIPQVMEDSYFKFTARSDSSLIRNEELLVAQ